MQSISTAQQIKNRDDGVIVVVASAASRGVRERYRLRLRRVISARALQRVISGCVSERYSA